MSWAGALKEAAIKKENTPEGLISFGMRSSYDGRGLVNDFRLFWNVGYFLLVKECLDDVEGQIFSPSRSP